MDAVRVELPQGTLDLLMLQTVALAPRHGCAIAERIGQITGGRVQVKPGSLYPALHRLERRGWLRARWARSEHGRRAKFYELTAAGRRRLHAETAAWHNLTGAVACVLEAP